MVWTRAQFVLPFFPCQRLPSRPFPRSSTFSWPDTAPFRSCLSFLPGSLCHAGGWHLRRKLRVVLPLRLHLCISGRRSAQPNSDSLRRISFQKLLTRGVLFFFAEPFFFSHLTGQVHSLSIIDHAFGVRLNTLNYDYLLVPSPPSHRTKKSCTMLLPSVFPLGCGENDFRVLPEL